MCYKPKLESGRSWHLSTQALLASWQAIQDRSLACLRKFKPQSSQLGLRLLQLGNVTWRRATQDVPYQRFHFGWQFSKLYIFVYQCIRVTMSISLSSRHDLLQEETREFSAPLALLHHVKLVWSWWRQRSSDFESYQCLSSS